MSHEVTSPAVMASACQTLIYNLPFLGVAVLPRPQVHPSFHGTPDYINHGKAKNGRRRVATFPVNGERS